ncbi:hypothetical protein FDC45_15955 [Clostridium botulinum]|uniref:Uncharacterized protein n=1 Tax=Clostridium botulinum TaxID=1491 RepID=A0A846J6N3_CLOBO|nr:hypothetical protein [Clostridium botulinum]ACA57560.1 hypothetical protein CLK_A0201 [Clostridium botulinum A3 str. Loch Maree]NFH64978.1 hypothetical protein [Clostridium botulinum]NFJ09569.1 hypothetical protein [Clostridium botulinum]NFK16538.1 hypothetical protein [Clostridium botulinum]NFM93503.1 hypothetical protein [Clostridium botulinum]
MNKRIKKKKEKNIIQICKSISWEYMHKGYPTYWEENSTIKKHEIIDADDLYEYKEEMLKKEMLKKVVKRCVAEHFPIQNYNIFEIPYGDKEGWMMDFVNTKEYEEYHKNDNKNIKIHEIDFWVEKNGEAIPQLYNPKTGSQSDAIDCKSAVWTE